MQCKCKCMKHLIFPEEYAHIFPIASFQAFIVGSTNSLVTFDVKISRQMYDELRQNAKISFIPVKLYPFVIRILILGSNCSMFHISSLCAIVYSCSCFIYPHFEVYLAMPSLYFSYLSSLETQAQF